ncbi:hydroxylamine reductase [Halorubrum ezzemoulense]|uniref:hydroxylamine reductase n=1 Tax=Halorubrum ezzemoulense TaxID=337243 RepID=UPI00232C20D0|nr:hydroxylamine reductase [Halorubrum ezzemoulense]MDB2225903.1 hydroxylamine reductase [Halorubrum ezzemoulense]MDB2262270.1 hydroxylamine reductase [Halorubrum ezzemoulense]MDB2265094.1 hydroxylamine reductase [Halorubrum ezzemoulense]MDB2269111.1 hydroxylamine reductase [Halorubrum ezzemoulense]MDB2272111.1 hydroxylamine reductase [Halorubrum ezzemoulense]
MYCDQCQETLSNEACTDTGVCGKDAQTSNIQDLFVWELRGLAYLAEEARAEGIVDGDLRVFIAEGLFSTITNVNFDPEWFEEQIREGFERRRNLRERYEREVGPIDEAALPEAATWEAAESAAFYEKAPEIGVQTTENEDIQSLRELLTYGIKGIAAYADHAYVLGEQKDEVFAFVQRGLAATLDDELSVDDLIGLVLEAGEIGTEVMAALDEAHTSTYGHPEPTEVDIGVRDRPTVLVSGHDLKDLEELLEQTEGEGVDVYTHGEMLPAHAYPAFEEYDHFVGNYGNAWWQQHEELEAFNGPVLMTTNCLVPPKDSYAGRTYTTGVVRFPGLPHVEGRVDGGQKDFSALIEHAKETEPPEQIETGTVPNGFTHDAVLSRVDDIIEAIQAGDIRGFVVMGGCDGRHPKREYYTEMAESLPDDVIILTAGCAKYRYNKLDLGDIGEIPRVLDAGQCNDSYSLLKIAMELQAALGVEDINDLPIAYDIAWYEQKAVTVLLALLRQGVEGIRLGPTLPAFLSENVAELLVEEFDIKPVDSVESDREAIIEELESSPLVAPSM